MAQQGKQMRVCDRKDFAYDMIKLVLLVNGDRYEVDSSAFFCLAQSSIYSKYGQVPNSDHS
jgi:hypothetical protein